MKLHAWGPAMGVANGLSQTGSCFCYQGLKYMVQQRLLEVRRVREDGPIQPPEIAALIRGWLACAARAG